MSYASEEVKSLPTPLALSFYRRRADVVARALIGKTLLCQSPFGIAGGVIVETEAYLSADDPACHANRGMTPRNEAMFGPPGHLYVYSIHAKYCLNAVTERKGLGSAVLIRAIEPVWGIELMKQRRKQTELLRLCRGPGMLCQALGVDDRRNRTDLTTADSVWIGRAIDRRWREVQSSPRIGISQATQLLLRYFVRGSRYVSGSRKLHDLGS